MDKPLKKCVGCGGGIPFMRRPDAIYCSRTCSGLVRQKAYYRRNPELSKHQWRSYYRSNRGTVTALLNNAQDRARRGGFEFDLDREFITEKLAIGVCEFSGLPFELGWSGENFRARPFAPSLDRIIPAKGYVKTNVRMICFAVNMALSDWGDEVFFKIVRAVALTIDS